MKKLLAGFGLLMTTGCAQQTTLDAAPNAFAKHTVYVVTADCGDSSCPYPGWPRYVFVTRNVADARQRFVEVAQEMVNANPDSSSIMGSARQIAFGDKLNPPWSGAKPNRIISWTNGSTFSVNLDISYL